MYTKFSVWSNTYNSDRKKKGSSIKLDSVYQNLTASVSYTTSNIVELFDLGEGW